MISKAEMVTIDSQLSRDELFQVIDEHEHTRYPITDGKDKDKLIGFLNAKELLTSMAAGRTPEPKSFVHEMPSFPETTPIQKVLTKMQQTRIHMAIVTTTDGKTAGLVTMEDILEEISDESFDLLPRQI